MSISAALLPRAKEFRPWDWHQLAGDPVLQLLITEEDRMGWDWLPFYQRAPYDIHFLYEFQTALLVMLGKLSLDDGRLPPPIAPRLAAHSFARIATLRDITEGLDRRLRRPVGWAEKDDEPAFMDRPAHGTRGGMLSRTPRRPAFSTDHASTYRTAALSANISAVTAFEADPLQFESNYNVLGANGVSLGLQLLKKCHACTGRGDTPTEEQCLAVLRELFDVYGRVTGVKGAILVQGFVARQHADAVLLPTMPYGRTLELGSAQETQRAVLDNPKLAHNVQWRVLPRLRYVLAGSIRANVVYSGPVLVDRRALLLALVEAMRARALDRRWARGLGFCIDSSHNTDPSTPGRWRQFGDHLSRVPSHWTRSPPPPVVPSVFPEMLPSFLGPDEPAPAPVIAEEAPVLPPARWVMTNPAV